MLWEITAVVRAAPFEEEASDLRGEIYQQLSGAHSAGEVTLYSSPAHVFASSNRSETTTDGEYR